MPRAARGFQVNDITQYRPAPELADGAADTGVEVSLYNAPSAISGLLDFGPLAATAARLHAIVNYRNAPLMAWRYSQDGAAWTTVTSSVLAGSATDAALPGRSCLYGSATTVTTLSSGGIQARFWQVSIQDSDVRTGGVWQCGGYSHAASAAGLMEMWAEDASGARLIELITLPLALETVTVTDGPTVIGDGVQEFAAGEGG